MISREDLNALHESKESAIKNAEYDISYWFDDIIENELYSKAIFGNDDPLPVTFEIDNATDKDVPVLIVNENEYYPLRNKHVNHYIREKHLSALPLSMLNKIFLQALKHCLRKAEKVGYVVLSDEQSAMHTWQIYWKR